MRVFAEFSGPMNTAVWPQKKAKRGWNIISMLGKRTLSDCLASVSNVQRLFGGSRALFTGPASTFFHKNNFKTGFHVLFTYLKIILLQCFQFSVFNNKQYSNRP